MVYTTIRIYEDDGIKLHILKKKMKYDDVADTIKGLLAPLDINKLIRS